jgi:hypothetical protein
MGKVCHQEVELKTERVKLMKYSLRSLMIATLVGPPSLAALWWLRGTWSVQVVMIIVLMLIALCAVCGCGWLIIIVIDAIRRLVLSTSQAPDPNQPKP